MLESCSQIPSYLLHCLCDARRHQRPPIAIAVPSMADPDVIHSSEESEENDPSQAIVDCAAAAGQCCSESDGFPDLSNFVEERKEHELDAMFANRFTVDDDLYAEVSNGFPKPIVIYPWASRPKRNYDYSRRRGGAQEDGESPGKRWRGREDSRRPCNSWRGGGDSGWRGGDCRSHHGSDGDWRREGNQDWRSKGRGRGQSHWQGSRHAEGSSADEENRRRQSNQVRAEKSDLVSYPGRYK
uniref:Uncharacterized protein n=2 Tax=Parascaris univalens TaxID=6257 RepID=A0A915AF73_PARUN